MSKELKPCPFCGQIPDWYKDNGYPFIIACYGDECEVRPEVSRFTEESAIAAWNKRAGE